MEHTFGQFDFLILILTPIKYSMLIDPELLAIPFPVFPVIRNNFTLHSEIGKRYCAMIKVDLG